MPSQPASVISRKNNMANMAKRAAIDEFVHINRVNMKKAAQALEAKGASTHVLYASQHSMIEKLLKRLMVEGDLSAGLAREWVINKTVNIYPEKFISIVRRATRHHKNLASNDKKFLKKILGGQKEMTVHHRRPITQFCYSLGPSKFTAVTDENQFNFLNTRGWTIHDKQYADLPAQKTLISRARLFPSRRVFYVDYPFVNLENMIFKRVNECIKMDEYRTHYYFIETYRHCMVALVNDYGLLDVYDPHIGDMSSCLSENVRWLFGFLPQYLKGRFDAIKTVLGKHKTILKDDWVKNLGWDKDAQTMRIVVAEYEQYDPAGIFADNSSDEANYEVNDEVEIAKKMPPLPISWD